ncbi:hypothetical protein SERLA73DRAFT_79911 [Serpula lacrymans var. lacrymans S7.3]|uniref:Uncharacterized protein n=1 Tax=Serpula lacrymans var. lacrymans (strain S7.3) TaxID=936435 RepID=F8QI14_SERL3|nr:hypothetical protein SERLA73DRAFT_79911 [Serpula lacrymans var. lacrymans S7.3]
MVDASHRECPPARLVLAPDDHRNLYPRPLPPHRGRGGPSSTWMQMLGPARGLDASRKPQRKRAANVESLKFIYDWNNKGSRPGGKKWKTQTYIAMFQLLGPYSEAFQRLDEHEKAEKMGNLQVEFKKWKPSRKEQITLRNNFYKLYNEV